MVFSLFRVKYVPVHTAFHVNRAWIVQDRLLANGIEAHIERESCLRSESCKGGESYSVCVPGNRADKAKKLIDMHVQEQ